MSGKGFFVPPSMRQQEPPPQHYQQHYQQQQHYPQQNGYSNGGHQQYAPPPGPPPGYTGPSNGYSNGYSNGHSNGHSNGSFRPPSQQQHGGYNGYNGAPPQQPPRPGQGAPTNGKQFPSSAGGAKDSGPWVAPRIGMTRLTRHSWLWTDYNHDGEVVCEIGPVCKGEALYSCKFGMSGRTKLKTGNYDQDGPMIGEVAVKGFLTSKYTPTFNGFETEMKSKSYSISGSVKKWQFDIPVNGGIETFEWTPHDKSMTARLTDQKGWELRRKGSAENSHPLVIYKDQEGNGFSTKTKQGTVEFQDAVAQGQLGDAFPNMVILTLLNLRQQRHIENIASAV